MYLSHRGDLVILAYNWAMSAVLAGDIGRGEMLLFLLFLPFVSLLFPLPSLSFLPFNVRRHKMTHKG